MKKLNFHHFISFFLTFVFLFVSTNTKGEIIDRVVAIVNKEVITLSELLEAAQLRAPEANPNLTLEKYREILRNMIDQKLIEQEANQTEIKVSDREVDEFIERFKKRNAITTSQLKEALKQQGLTWEKYREKLREEIKRSQVISQKIHSQVSITEKEIEEYYQSHMEDYIKPPQVKIDQIFFPFSSKLTSEEEKNLILKAEEALKRIRSGEDFQKIAQEYNPTRKSYPQDLDYFKKGELMEPLDKAAFKLRIGEVSGIIKTKKGYFIIQVLDRKEAEIKELSEVRKEIEAKIHQEKTEKKLEEWLKALYNKAYIEIKI
jgi:peptidyl-prolyl cis-trans isomerase SurA